MKNNCIREVGWWIFKRKIVVHTWKVSFISKFMRSSETFHVHSECKCGATKTERFVELDKLILAGYPAEELKKVTGLNYYEPNKQ